MFQQKNPQGALEKFRQAAKADPRGTLTAEAALALCYERHGDHAQAVKWMAQAVKAAREDLRTRLTAAQWALDTEQVAEARNSAEEALRIDPKSTDARLLRGAVALFQKDYAEAEKQYEAAHLQSPASFVASNNLAAALCEQNDESKKRRALAWAESNFQQNPRSREAAATLGRVLYQVGQLNRAEESLRLATQGGNATSDTAYYLARVLLDRGRKDEAKIWLDAAVKAKGPFAMRPEATELLGKLKSGPPKK
jgi:Tfp pilus assembly protein PilF